MLLNDYAPPPQVVLKVGLEATFAPRRKVIRMGAIGAISFPARTSIALYWRLCHFDIHDAFAT